MFVHISEIAYRDEVHRASTLDASGGTTGTLRGLRTLVFHDVVLVPSVIAKELHIVLQAPKYDEKDVVSFTSRAKKQTHSLNDLYEKFETSKKRGRGVWTITYIGGVNGGSKEGRGVYDIPNDRIVSVAPKASPSPD